MAKSKNQQNISINNSSNIKIGNLSINSDSEPVPQDEKKESKQKTLSEITKLIQSGYTKQALHQIISNQKQFEIDLRKRATLQLARLSNIEHQKQNGLIKFEQCNMEMNRINEAVLALLDS